MSTNSNFDTLHNILSSSTYYEMSHKIESHIPSWPSSAVELQQSHILTHEKHKSSKWAVHIGCDAGTHIDSPFHFYPNAPTITDLPTKNFFVPLVIIDISKRASNNPDAEVNIDDIKQYESNYGTIKHNSFIAMRSGWTKRWSSKEQYLNRDNSMTSKLYKGGRMRFPGFSVDSVKWLISERNISGIGVDTLSFDAGVVDSFPVHQVLLPTNRYGIENMNVTDDIPVNGCMLVCLPTRLKDCPEIWIRCVAVKPNENNQSQKQSSKL